MFKTPNQRQSKRFLEGHSIDHCKCRMSRRMSNAPLPSAVFLDTSILAGQNFNFESTALASFVPVAKRGGLKFLLPDPTEREVIRQIDERSVKALEALARARREAPFLAKWKHFPPIRPSRALAHPATNWEVRQIAMQEWESFLKQFHVIKIDYKGLDVSLVMRWYDETTPPFREGPKRKEFPDAFAVAMLADYARTHDCVVAVVSADNDFKLACERYTSFLYFDALPALTELLLADPEKIEKIRAAILEDMSELKVALVDEANKQDYGHVDSNYTIKKSAVHSVDVNEVRIVALGVNECTATFEAELETEHLVKQTYWDDDSGDPDEEKWVYALDRITGTAKFGLDSSSKVKSITSIDTDIGSIEITSYPED